MSKRIDSLGAKIAALFLLLSLFVLSVAGLLTAEYLYEESYYDLSRFNFYTTQNCRQLNQEYARYAFDYYLLETAEDTSGWDSYQAAHIRELLNPETANFLFDVINDRQETVFSTYDGQAAYGITASCGQYEYNGETFTLIAHIRSPLLPGDNYYQTAYWLEKLFHYRYAILWGSGVALLLCLALFIFLLATAGHKRNTVGICLNRQDRIPYDLYLCAAALLLSFLARMLPYLGGYPIWATVTAATFLFTAMLAVLTAVALTTATRLKCGVLLKNTVLYRILRWIWSLLKGGACSLGNLCASLPAAGKCLLATALLFLCNLFCFGRIYHAYQYVGTNIWPWLLLLLFIYLAVFYTGSKAAWQAQRLFDYGRRLSQGREESPLAVADMYAPLRRHGEDLNNIGKGIHTAIEASLKSERLKTELITNVSHDIKTPLTSIINYVDLLKKEPQASEKATEYLAVLERQSAKLKKLTEDLIEASKAATGNIKVNLQPTNVNELLQQTVAEYQDRLAAARLQTVISSDQEDIFIAADGRLLWRVIDNLLNNVCKYSLPHSRVYFQVCQEQQYVYIRIKNISREPLNISAEELMERFVQGDASRSSEGSGLGLSIARSLTELQNGSLRLKIDGDLFKAELIFAQAAKPAGENDGGETG
ncbi:MAG: HAMP domain-containing histidine kinase [Firmicutes bacterium]|nr:HAMP domain-containing histidine kinase [Bacillota bacterium]